MKRLLALGTLIFAAVLVSGCGLGSTPTPPPANVTCNELSFYLDPSLGSSYDCVTQPESNDLISPGYTVFVYPAHTELTIQDYPLTKTQFPPQVWVYPLTRFAELLPDVIPSRVSKLKSLLANEPWGGGALPFLPTIPQVQSFVTHQANLAFNGGKGVRFITQYTEGLGPISNQNIIYTFQGLTDDGRYWVAVTLPISSPILPADYDTLPEGYTMESLIANYDSYVSDVKNALASQAPESFSPSIGSLDNLVKSITIGK